MYRCGCVCVYMFEEYRGEICVWMCGSMGNESSSAYGRKGNRTGWCILHIAFFVCMKGNRLAFEMLLSHSYSCKTFLNTDQIELNDNIVRKRSAI